MTQLLTKEQVRKKYKALFTRLVTPIATLSSDACELFIDLCETSNEEKFRHALGDFAAALLFIYRHFNELYKLKRGTIKTFLLDTQTDDQLREIETIILKSDMFADLSTWSRQELDILDPSTNTDDCINIKKVMHLFLNLDLSDSNSIFDRDSEDNQGYDELESDEDIDTTNLLRMSEQEIPKPKKPIYTKAYEKTKHIVQEVLTMRGLECYDSLFDDAVIEF